MLIYIMKAFAKLTAALAASLTLTVGVNAQDTSAGDPYAVVVTRNVFGLNPPAPPAPPTAAEPPPKIIPNGIMDIFGQLQVLFKVPATPKAGVPAIDQSYILSEGQRQDDIEVMKIDGKAGIITFNNHGEVQQLALVVTQPSSTAAAAPAAAPGGAIPGGPNGGRFSPGLGNPGGSVRPNGAGYNGAGVNPANAGNPNDGSNLRPVPTRNNTFNAASQVPAGLTEEVQTIAIEAGRLQAQQQGDPTHVIYPITELTGQLNGSGGTPAQ